MGFPAKNHLERPNMPRDGFQPIQIRKQEIGAFVSGGPSRERNSQNARIEFGARVSFDLSQELQLGGGVSLTDFFERYANDVAQVEIVLAPFGDVAVVQLLKA